MVVDKYSLCGRILGYSLTQSIGTGERVHIGTDDNIGLIDRSICNMVAIVAVDNYILRIGNPTQVIGVVVGKCAGNFTQASSMNI